MNLPQPKMFLWDAAVELGFKSKIHYVTEDKIVWKEEPIQDDLYAIQERANELKVEWKNNAYARLRKIEYDKLNQYELMYDDQINGTTTWQDAIEAIKAKYPKPGV